MFHVKQIEKSPISNKALVSFLKCKDHTVSRETFSICIDHDSELLVTTPRPLEERLGAYYKSDSYISHTDSKKSFIDKVYQIVRNFAIRRKVNLINSFTISDKNILDIGTGTGDFLLACKQNGWNVTGVEPNQKAKKQSEYKTGIKVVNDISELKNMQFDVITMWHVLEHVSDLRAYVTSLKKLLKPKGTLVVAVPNYKSHDAVYYKQFWAAYDVPRHLWHFSRLSIKKLFELEEMKVVKTLPMIFDSFYVSLLSEKYKTGNSNILKAFLIGLQSNFKARTSKEYSSLIYIIKIS